MKRRGEMERGRENVERMRKWRENKEMGERENGERMRKWKANKEVERERKWRE